MIDTTLAMAAFGGVCGLVVLIFLLVGSRNPQIDRRLAEVSRPTPPRASPWQTALTLLSGLGAKLMPEKKEKSDRVRTRLLQAGLYRRHASALFAALRFLLLVLPASVGVALGLHPSSFILFFPRRRGAAIVELALALPALLSLALLAVDFGQVASCYVAVTNAARAGAGYGSANAYTSATQAAWQAASIQAAKDEFATNSWYNAANLTVATPVVTQEGNGYWRVSVTVTYSFRTLVNWTLLPNYNTPVSLTRTVVMRATI